MYITTMFCYLTFSRKYYDRNNRWARFDLAFSNKSNLLFFNAGCALKHSYPSGNIFVYGKSDCKEQSQKNIIVYG